jgi:DNA-binding winged helix-turn-helix (wHTH) protein
MSDRATGERSFNFGAWRVLPARGLLVARGTDAEVRIEPRLMDLLILFATSGGAVLSKDHIIASVWDGRAIGDDTLASAVSRLRTALGADRENRYIETVPKRGYRLASSTLADTAKATPAPKNAEAERLIAQGRALLKGGSPMSLPQAWLYFEAAIRADPRMAEAQAGLAEVLFAQHMTGQGSAPALLSAGRAAAYAATGLDDTCAAGWSALGYANLVADRASGAADRAFLRAIDLAPTAAGPRRYRAFGLAAAGRFVEAEREARRAVALDPLALPARGGLLQILLAARRYRQAAAEAQTLIDLADQSAEAWYALGWARLFLGETQTGVDALLNGLACWGVDEPSLARLRAAQAENGLAGLCAAGADLFSTQHVLFTPRLTDIAILRAFAGQADLAFAALEAAAAWSDPYLLLLEQFPWFDVLNNDPRWRPLVERTRLRD